MTLTLDKSHLDQFENIAPPMKDALTLPVLGTHGVLIYVCRSPFSAHMPQAAKRGDVLRVAQALTLALIMLATTAWAGDNRKHERSSADYILRRQESGAVEGTPSVRRIIGKREIDVYRNGLMFEKDSVVGVAK
jgi:hypothetical protein